MKAAVLFGLVGERLAEVLWRDATCLLDCGRCSKGRGTLNPSLPALTSTLESINHLATSTTSALLDSSWASATGARTRSGSDAVVDYKGGRALDRSSANPGYGSFSDSQ